MSENQNRYSLEELKVIHGLETNTNNRLIIKVRIIEVLKNTNASKTCSDILRDLNLDKAEDEMVIKRTVEKCLKELREQKNSPLIATPVELGKGWKYSIEPEEEEKEPIISILSEVQTDRPSDEDILIDFPSEKYKGIQYFTKIYGAVKNQKVIQFTYLKSYEEVIMDIKVLPYQLKEHNGRWYIIGRIDDNKRDFNFFALDRIEDTQGVSVLEEDFDRQNDPRKAHWMYSSGIYMEWKNSDLKNTSEVKPERDPLIITFKVKDGEKFDNISYLKSKKLHRSQKESANADKDGYIKITLEMYPDTDLVRELRRIGLHCIKDIKVAWKYSNNDPLPDLDKWVRGM